MDFGVPLNELAWLVLLIVAGGAVTGILAGLFGIGGGGIRTREYALGSPAVAMVRHGHE